MRDKDGFTTPKRQRASHFYKSETHQCDISDDTDFHILHDLRAKDVELPNHQPTLYPDSSHLHIGSQAMVSSDIGLCSLMGKNILLRGGNAADAAVTVALCIGSVNSQSSGIGGGGFIVSSLGDDVVSIDAREMAPEYSYELMYESNPILSIVGGLSNGIPGELKGLDYLFHTHGSGNLSWYEVVEPVIRLNKEGFECPAILAYAFQSLHEKYFPQLPSLSKVWDFIYNDDGTVIQQGEIVKRPNLARTLEIIARNGSLAIFYDPQGPIASSLIGANRRWGGIFTKKDFELYDLHIEPALKSEFNEYEVFTSSGISSGLVLLSGLNLYLKLYLEADEPYLEVHKLIETMKWMASVRSRLGDHNEKDHYAELVQNYTSPEWAYDVKNNKYSDNNTFSWEHYESLYEQIEPHGTSHFSILDQDNNAVSMTTTVNLLFGSIVYDPVTGIILNNEMDDFLTKSFNNSFGLLPSKLNLIQPHKRPLSSTAPTIIKKNGVIDMLVGAAGGSRITTAVFEAITRTYLRKKALLETIAFPRLHHQLIPETVSLENASLTDSEFGGIISKLEEMGHSFDEAGCHTSMNGIKRQGDKLYGVADFWRKGAEADGY